MAVRRFRDIMGDLTPERRERIEVHKQRLTAELEALERGVFTAEAVYDDGWWAILITNGLPSHMVGGTQTRHEHDIEPMARQVVADLFEIDPNDTFELTVTIKT